MEVFFALLDLLGDNLGDTRITDGTQVGLGSLLLVSIFPISEGDVLSFGASSFGLGSTCLITSQLRFNFFGRRCPQSTGKDHRRGLLRDRYGSTGDARRQGHVASRFNVRRSSRNLGLCIGREFGNGAHECTLVPFLAHEDLIDASRMDRKGNEGKFTWRDFRGNTGGMGFVTSGIRVGGEDDEMNGRLRSRELDDLFEETTPDDPTGRRSRDIKPNPQRDQTVSAVVGNPQGLNPRVVVDVAKHFWILLGAIDESKGGENVLCNDGEQLEHGAILAADDDAVVDKRQRGGEVVSTDAVCPEWTLVVNIPQGQSRVLGNGRQRKVRNVKVERNQALRECIRNER